MNKLKKLIMIVVLSTIFLACDDSKTGKVTESIRHAKDKYYSELENNNIVETNASIKNSYDEVYRLMYNKKNNSYFYIHEKTDNYVYTKKLNTLNNEILKTYDTALLFDDENLKNKLTEKELPKDKSTSNTTINNGVINKNVYLSEQHILPKKSEKELKAERLQREIEELQKELGNL